MAGIVATVGPTLAYVLGNRLKNCAKLVFKHVVFPLHKYGVLELAAYGMLGLISVQAYRYPPQHATAASMVGLVAGLGLIPCWVYTLLVFPVPAGYWMVRKNMGHHAYQAVDRR